MQRIFGPHSRPAFRRIIQTSAVFLLVLVLSTQGTAYALSPAQKKLFRAGIYQFDVETAAGTCSASADLSGSSNEEKVWNYFAGQGLKPVAVAGIMGNLVQEDSTYDPAAKQGGTMNAIPDGGDDVTGYGIAQWTSQGRQALLFKLIRDAGLQQYYGAGWGNQEKDKDIPAGDIDKLLTIELNFAWSGDTTKIKDIAGQLNKATSVEGDTGSAVLFHKLFERSGDDASQIQERVTSAGEILQKYAGSGALASGSCSTGDLGGVASMEDAIPWANRFISDTAKKYDSPYAKAKLLKGAATDGGTVMTIAEWPESTSFVCWGAYGCDECTTLSGWFVTAMTDYTYGGGNGGDVVGNLAAKGVKTGKEPKPYAVWSTFSVGGSAGHTGVVLGVLENGEVIGLENNNGANLLKIFKYNIKERYPDITFAYVGDKIKDTSLPTVGQ